TAVRRGVESPWERIRGLKARTKTPLGMALRGRFLVGSRPVGGDFARRFVASAAESGIDFSRLEGPLNDVENLREAGEAIVAADREFEAGLIYSPGRGGGTKPLLEEGKKLPDVGAPRGALHAAPGRGGPPGRPLLPGRGGERSRRSARSRSSGSRPRCLRGLSDRAGAPPSLGGGPRECACRRRDGQRRQRRDAVA